MSEDPTTASPDLVAALVAAEAPASPPETPPETPPAAPPVEPAAPPAEPQPVQPTAAGPTDGEPTATDDEALKLTRFIDEGWGEKLGEKYTGDNATITGLVEAYRLVGRRDADAEYGRSVRGHEPAFREFMQQRQQVQQPQPTAQQSPEWDDIRRWQDIVAREGENAPPDVKRSLEDATQKIQRAAYDFAYHRNEALAEPVQQLSAPVVQQINQQQTAQQQEAAAIGQIVEANASWAFRNPQANRQDPNNVTPDGAEWMEIAGQIMQAEAAQQQAMGMQAAPNRVNAFSHARLILMERRIQQQQAQPAQSTQAVKPAAVHQPAVAAPVAGDPEAEYRADLEKWGGTPGGMGEHLAKLAAQREATQGQLG
jgi:hypothetical protein